MIIIVFKNKRKIKYRDEKYLTDNIKTKSFFRTIKTIGSEEKTKKKCIYIYTRFNFFNLFRIQIQFKTLHKTTGA